MVIAMSLPNLVYVYLSWVLPENFFMINACVFIEQFGYGFGFTAYMLFLIFFQKEIIKQPIMLYVRHLWP